MAGGRDWMNGDGSGGTDLIVFWLLVLAVSCCVDGCVCWLDVGIVLYSSF